eukprot:2325908-Amphidinium_carterae.1
MQLMISKEEFETNGNPNYDAIGLRTFNKESVEIADDSATRFRITQQLNGYQNTFKYAYHPTAIHYRINSPNPHT